VTGAVKVEGLATLKQSLNTFSRSLDDMPDAQAKVGTVVRNDARRRAPMRSGRLASSSFATATGNTATVGFAAAHAGPLQFGVGPRVGLRGPHNIAPRDYLFAAVDARTDDAVSILTDAVDVRLGRVKGA
jgi:hypothetical protein